MANEIGKQKKNEKKIGEDIKKILSILFRKWMWQSIYQLCTEKCSRRSQRISNRNFFYRECAS